MDFLQATQHIFFLSMHVHNPFKLSPQIKYLSRTSTKFYGFAKITKILIKLVDSLIHNLANKINTKVTNVKVLMKTTGQISSEI